MWFKSIFLANMAAAHGAAVFVSVREYLQGVNFCPLGFYDCDHGGECQSCYYTVPGRKSELLPECSISLKFTHSSSR